jgi:hypothetical protein
MTWGELAAAIAKMPSAEMHAPVSVYDKVMDDFAEPEFTQAKQDTEIYAKGDYYLEV